MRALGVMDDAVLAAAKDAVTWGREWLYTADRLLPAARPGALRQLVSGLVALGNVGSADDVQLAQPFADGEDPMLQEQARWTIARLEERPLGEG